MNTKQAETETVIGRMNAAFERLRTDMARRDRDNLRWTVEFGVARIAVTIDVLVAGFAFLALVGMPAK